MIVSYLGITASIYWCGFLNSLLVLRCRYISGVRGEVWWIIHKTTSCSIDITSLLWVRDQYPLVDPGAGSWVGSSFHRRRYTRSKGKTISAGACVSQICLLFSRPFFFWSSDSSFQTANLHSIMLSDCKKVLFVVLYQFSECVSVPGVKAIKKKCRSFETDFFGMKLDYVLNYITFSYHTCTLIIP